MTEYDYSPDAMERFQTKMAGVGKWATDQDYWRSGYGNPFVPDPHVSPTTTRPRPSSRQDTSPTRPRDRPQPSRSRTLPVNVAVAAATPPAPILYGQTSRALAYAQTPASRPPTSTQSRSHHRSGSQPPDVRNPYPYPAPAPRHQPVQGPRGSPMVYAAPAAHVIYKQYDYVPGKATVLPAARPGERFVVVAPPGGHVDVMGANRLRTTSHSRSQSYSNSRSSGSKASSPTKKGADPLFKRIFTGLKPNIEWGGDRDGSRSRSGSRREGSKRRSASR